VPVTTLPATKQTLLWEKFQSFPEKKKKRKRKRKKEWIRHEETTWESVFQENILDVTNRKLRGK
jgi:hypothetical protein